MLGHRHWNFHSLNAELLLIELKYFVSIKVIILIEFEQYDTPNAYSLNVLDNKWPNSIHYFPNLANYFINSVNNSSNFVNIQRNRSMVNVWKCLWICIGATIFFKIGILLHYTNLTLSINPELFLKNNISINRPPALKN